MMAEEADQYIDLIQRVKNLEELVADLDINAFQEQLHSLRSN